MGGGGKAMQAGASVQDGQGRFIAGAKLTDQQTRFVERYISNGCRQTDAARVAGYANPGPEGWRLMQNSAVLAEIRRATGKLVEKGGAVGLSVLIQVATDDAQPAAARVSAGKWLAEAAGHGLAPQRAGHRDNLEEKPLEEMTIGELEAFIGGGRAALDRQRERTQGAISVESVDVTHEDARNEQIGGAES